MSTKCRLVSIGAAVAVMLVGGSAWAYTKDEAKCLDQYNNKLRLVSQTSGKEVRGCIKDAGKGNNLNPDACLDADADGKVATKVGKYNELFLAGEKCNGAGFLPADIVQIPTTIGSNAHIQGPIDLVHDMFSLPVGGVVDPGKDQAKCQDRAVQRSTQYFTSLMKVHRSCKKDGTKDGLINNETDLETMCMPGSGIPDPKLKAQKKADKITSDVGADCGAVGALSGLFPGQAASCTATAAALAACLINDVQCRVCRTLNTADGTATDCDLFDDGNTANDSCKELPTLHKCTLGGGLLQSYVRIYAEAFMGTPLAFNTSGSSIDIGGALTNSDAACGVQNFNPINIPSIGFVCIDPGGGCPLGTRHCPAGAGPALGIDVQSDGNIGACTSNPACDTSCTAFCPSGPGFGAGFSMLNSGCTGRCTGGAGATACTSDDQCNNAGLGACNGPDNPAPAQQDICQCSCIKTDAWGASASGETQCNLGARLTVEMQSPCNQTDLLINVGEACIPVTTQRANGHVRDANFSTGGVPDPAVNDQSGARGTCAAVDSSVTGATTGVGAVNFFGSSLGDLTVGLSANCN